MLANVPRTTGPTTGYERHDRPRETSAIEDRSEASLSQIAEKFKVVLFGAGKTIYAPPDQPALQVLLQYRNLYELSIRSITMSVEQGIPPTPDMYSRSTQLLDRMWSVILSCMREYNKATHAKARLMQAERLTMAKLTPTTYTVPNPGFSKVPQRRPAPLVAPDGTPDDDLIVLDPKDVDPYS